MTEQQRQYDTKIVDAVRAVVLKRAVPRRIYLYISRVTGNAQPESDENFAFDVPDADPLTLEKIREALDELHSHCRIDVANAAKADSRIANTGVQDRRPCHLRRPQRTTRTGRVDVL